MASCVRGTAFIVRVYVSVGIGVGCMCAWFSWFVCVINEFSVFSLYINGDLFASRWSVMRNIFYFSLLLRLVYVNIFLHRQLRACIHRTDWIIRLPTESHGAAFFIVRNFSLLCLLSLSLAHLHTHQHLSTHFHLSFVFRHFHYRCDSGSCRSFSISNRLLLLLIYNNNEESIRQNTSTMRYDLIFAIIFRFKVRQSHFELNKIHAPLIVRVCRCICIMYILYTCSVSVHCYCHPRCEFVVVVVVCPWTSETKII